MKTIRRFSARQATTVWWIVFWIGTWGTVLGADADLTLLGGYDTSGYAWVVAMSGNYAYVAEELWRDVGTPTSATYQLRIFAVSPLLRIPPSSLQVVSGDQLSFKVSSEPGQPLEIQASKDLETWTTLGTLTNELGIADLIDPMNGRDRRFYRLRLAEP